MRIDLAANHSGFTQKITDRALKGALMTKTVTAGSTRCGPEKSLNSKGEGMPTMSAPHQYRANHTYRGEYYADPNQYRP